jgi:hypothetical protein
LLEGKVHHALQEIPHPQLSIISLLPFGQLLLDDIAGVGVGGMKLGESPQVALAGGLLAGYQVVVDEVGGEHLLQGV